MSRLMQAWLCLGAPVKSYQHDSFYQAKYLEKLVFVHVYRRPYPQTFWPEGLSRQACCLSLLSLPPVFFLHCPLCFIALDSKRVHS